MRDIQSAAGLLAAILLFANAQAAAHTALEKAARDELFLIPQGDPDMAAAMRKARAGLREFFALAQSPKPSMKGFSVKVGVRSGAGREFFWIRPFERKGNRYSGRLNNTPRVVTHLKAGDTITFGENEIVDWTYTEDGKMKGNYTACPLLKREPKEQAQAFIKQYGLDCEL
jgi:uncharacterized protein YegJ (DUF2314 family)